jgi:hypothetical protein
MNLEEESVRGLLRFSRCELLLLGCSSGQGPFGNTDEGERLLLEAATKQRLVKTVTD